MKHIIQQTFVCLVRRFANTRLVMGSFLLLLFGSGIVGIAQAAYVVDMDGYVMVTNTTSQSAADDTDYCPNTPPGESEDENGCSASQRDSDGDGIMDSADSCDWTPYGESVDPSGCSASQIDSDDDGVMDVDDLCESTASGDAVDADGCSAAQLAVDTDGDSIPDYLDQCAGTASGDTPNEFGCAPDQIDSDGDGIADHQDAYPHQSTLQCTP